MDGPIETQEQLDVFKGNIISITIDSLLTSLKSINLTELHKRATNIKWHIHDLTLREINLLFDSNTCHVIYICDSCSM